MQFVDALRQYIGRLRSCGTCSDPACNLTHTFDPVVKLDDEHIQRFRFLFPGQMPRNFRDGHSVLFMHRACMSKLTAVPTHHPDDPRRVYHFSTTPSDYQVYVTDLCQKYDIAVPARGFRDVDYQTIAAQIALQVHVGPWKQFVWFWYLFCFFIFQYVFSLGHMCMAKFGFLCMCVCMCCCSCTPIPRDCLCRLLGRWADRPAGWRICQKSSDSKYVSPNGACCGGRRQRFAVAISRPSRGLEHGHHSHAARVA